jgi:hypothetical protein
MTTRYGNSAATGAPVHPDGPDLHLRDANGQYWNISIPFWLSPMPYGVEGSHPTIHSWFSRCRNSVIAPRAADKSTARPEGEIECLPVGRNITCQSGMHVMGQARLLRSSHGCVALSCRNAFICRGGRHAEPPEDAAELKAHEWVCRLPTHAISMNAIPRRVETLCKGRLCSR